MRNKNKRANIIDIFVIAVFIFALSISFLFGKLILDEFTDQLGGENDTLLSNKSKEFINYNNDAYIPVFESIFVFVMAGLFIATLISAFFIRSHPVFFIIAIVLMGLFIFVNTIIGEVYDTVSKTSGVASTADSFNVLNFVMDQFPFFMIIFGIIVAIVLYSKISSEDI